MHKVKSNRAVVASLNFEFLNRIHDCVLYHGHYIVFVFLKTFSLAVFLVLAVAVTLTHGKENCPTPSPVCDADEFTAGKCILEGNICVAYVLTSPYSLCIAVLVLI